VGPSRGNVVVVITLRPALESELEELSALAIRSKSYWGYDAAFLEACREELTITASRVVEERIRVAEMECKVVGFTALKVGRRRAELMDLFVDPDMIGQGIGRLLWQDAVTGARDSGAKSLRIEADPHAEEWYMARGAERVGQVTSGSIPGRFLPLLRYELS